MDEDAKEILATIAECQTARAQDEYLEKRIERVLAAYRGVAACLRSAREFRPTVVDGKLQFPYQREAFSASDLLDEAGLTALIAEYEASEQRLAKVLRKRHQMGID